MIQNHKNYSNSPSTVLDFNQFQTEIHDRLCLTIAKNNIDYRGVVPQGAWRPQILADQLTLSQQGATDYAHLITTGNSGFSDLPTALK